jgi:hypothetical protein
MTIARAHQESITHLHGKAFAVDLQFQTATKRPNHLKMIVHVPAWSLTISAH